MEDLMKGLRNLKDFTQNCLTEIFKNDIHGIVSSISSIEHKLNSVENRVVELENDQQILRDDIVEQNVRVDSLFSTRESLENKIETAEQYSRRENLIFYGISESHSESPQAPKAKLLNMLKTVLPHTNWNDRDLVRVHSTELKSLGIGVSKDLTYNQRQDLKKHKENGHSAYYKNGVLHVDEGPTHHHNQNTDRLYSEVTASSSLNAELPTQARHIARPHRRIKGATHTSKGKKVHGNNNKKTGVQPNHINKTGAGDSQRPGPTSTKTVTTQMVQS
ncbi:hypothetical protein ElyMa_001819400 [Elysia marginata]|uniref:Uncharacterized protein n=1 Tax=Elysia marginata TaxID=1093978 RepID=A0AAV4EGW3_9GAST|nr:hypothetical protein ElyMa_001819400 [Elysia marginata]